MKMCSAKIIPEVATSLNNLALLLKAQKKYQEAEVQFKNAASWIVEEALGSDHQDVGTSLSLWLDSITSKGNAAKRFLYERAWRFGRCARQ